MIDADVLQRFASLGSLRSWRARALAGASALSLAGALTLLATSAGAPNGPVIISNAGPTTATTLVSPANPSRAGSPGPAAALTQQVAYRVQLLDARARPGESGPTVLLQLELLDAEGRNVSQPGIPVTVTGLSPRPATSTPPSRAFTAMNLGLWPCYQLTVNTAGYPAGTYTLSFTAGTDPTTHTARFTVP